MRTKNNKLLYIILVIMLLISITLVVLFSDMLIVDWLIVVAVFLVGLLSIRKSMVAGLITAFVITLLYGVSVLVTGTNESFSPIGINYYNLFMPSIAAMLLVGLGLVNQNNQEELEGDEDDFSNLFEYEKTLAIEVERAKRYELPLSLLAIRIESLNALIKAYDKSTGDKFINHFASFIVETTRQSDQHYRLEENLFLMILPCTDNEGAMLLKERFIEEFESMEIVVKSSHQPMLIEVDIIVESLEDHISASELHELIEIELAQRGKNEENN
ncbi:diguanylate cyclase [Acidaminobacter sp. JC074]|uniref:diguanylate cyclase domain-containing protein n=1 Tax=Acidaminobacter sp. JC074 TaxID=2530199 RepID=UPI001F0F6CC3|nr:diguanylate cyclase [Acidaminobacter sp. JC074]MCH4886809.1 diguanylate cyclase [Acidaminobacter sp. JC074]